MLDTGAILYVLIPGESKDHLLHAGKVLEAGPETFVAEFQESLPLRVGSAITTYCETNGQFVQQAASIVAIRQTEPTPVLALTRTGPVLSAEARNSYRLSLTPGDFFAQLADQPPCPIVDISPEGFALLTTQPLPVGARLAVTLTIDGRSVTNHACVQALRSLPNGQYRCGFLAEHKNAIMRRALLQLSNAAQAACLRRLSRSA